MSSQESPRYVRFGNLPRKPRSTNLLAGERLAGLSVYEGRLDEDRGFIIDTSNLNEQGLAALLGLAATDRPAFFVEGEKADTGPDGEPLLKITRLWPVPKSTNVTSAALYAQNALRLWSRGPRNGSGNKYLAWRLGHEESPYLPDEVSFSGRVLSPHAVAAWKKLKPDHKEKKRRQKQARKKQRAKKR